MVQFHETSLTSHRTSLFYGYPATTLLGASSHLAKFGIPAKQAFAGIMTLGISIPVALATVLCYVLRPKSLWFVGVGGIMIASQLYYSSTPPSAITVALCSVLMLYALYIYKKNKHDVRTAIQFGCIAGVALATRIDISAFVLFFLCVFLCSTIKKHIVTALCFAALVFFLCNPYMWAFPVGHIQDIVHKITYHTALGTASMFPYRKIFLTIPLSIMGVGASLLLLVFPKNQIRSVVPRAFLVTIIVLLLTLTLGLVIFSTYYPAWYFFPVLQIFEVLFILYILDALTVIGRTYAQWPVLSMLILGNLVVLIAKLFL